jgi:hypothetical protein
VINRCGWFVIGSLRGRAWCAGSPATGTPASVGSLTETRVHAHGPSCVRSAQALGLGGLVAGQGPALSTGSALGSDCRPPRADNE